MSLFHSKFAVSATKKHFRKPRQGSPSPKSSICGDGERAAKRSGGCRGEGSWYVVGVWERMSILENVFWPLTGIFPPWTSFVISRGSGKPVGNAPCGRKVRCARALMGLCSRINGGASGGGVYGSCAVSSCVSSRVTLAGVVFGEGEAKACLESLTQCPSSAIESWSRSPEPTLI